MNASCARQIRCVNLSRAALSRTALVALITSVAVFWSPRLVQAGMAGPDAVRVSHVRGLNPQAAGLIEEGLRRSPTFRRLAAALDVSDVIVLITTTGSPGVAGKIAFVSASSTVRFLQVALRVPEIEDQLLPCLAHELQHALEIASAPGVTSSARLAAYYRKFGQGTAPGQWCTVEAQRVARLVAAEIAAAPER